MIKQFTAALLTALALLSGPAFCDEQKEEHKNDVTQEETLKKVYTAVQFGADAEQLFVARYCDALLRFVNCTGRLAKAREFLKKSTFENSLAQTQLETFLTQNRPTTETCPVTQYYIAKIRSRGSDVIGYKVNLSPLKSNPGIQIKTAYIDLTLGISLGFNDNGTDGLYKVTNLEVSLQ